MGLNALERRSWSLIMDGKTEKIHDGNDKQWTTHFFCLLSHMHHVIIGRRIGRLDQLLRCNRNYLLQYLFTPCYYDYNYVLYVYLLYIL